MKASHKLRTTWFLFFNALTRLVRIKISKPFLLVLIENIRRERLENNLSAKTFEKHYFQYYNIKKFFVEKNIRLIQVHQIRVRHMEMLRKYLHQNVTKSNGTPCSVSHVTRHLRMCIKACDYAVTAEYIAYNAIQGIKLKRSPDKEVVSLTVEEVSRFEKYVADRELWNYIRDLFLFQCFTGLSYMDLWKFQIVYDQEIWWVTCETGRGKTKRIYWAEYSKKAQEIYLKYNGQLPRIVSQTYNKTIKKVAIELNISKELTTHIGRKTFATLKRNDGYSRPAIAGMLGCTEKNLKHYIHEGKELIINERQRLKPKRKSPAKRLAA